MAGRASSPGIVQRKKGTDKALSTDKEDDEKDDKKGPVDKKDDEATPGGFWEGFAGTVGGSFFREPRWVDTNKFPGTTNQQAPDGHNWKSYLIGSILFFGPNFVWWMVALIDYVIFPYEIDAAKVFTFNWMRYRFLANIVLVLGYVSFWHMSLYFLHWGKRPFNPDREYKWSKVLHNAFYSVCGIAQWTVWEALFVYCFATGRLPYITDEESFGTCKGLAMFAFTCLFVAVWRDVHFYFAHRVIHIKFFYKYVHSLHHRNTDIEPFAGLSMHPIEHLLYFACAGPALYMRASPFFLMWMGMHLLISPAASHSGFEDHFQSDQYHYLHHRFFECNYGTGGVPYDKWFGTFRDSLDVKSSTSYKGAAVDNLDAKSAALADSKATLIGMPTWDQFIYNLVTYVAIPVIVFSAAGVGPVSQQALGPLGNAYIVAFLMGIGPAIMGLLLLAATSRRPFANPSLTFLYPFHRESWLGVFGVNLLISLAVTVLPVYQMTYMFVSEPGQAVYFSLWAA